MYTQTFTLSTHGGWEVIEKLASPDYGYPTDKLKSLLDMIPLADSNTLGRYGYLAPYPCPVPTHPKNFKKFYLIFLWFGISPYVRS